MSNRSQNCWIDRNSVVLCCKRLFHIGVWTFARFMQPLLATIPCVWEILCGSNNRVYDVSCILLKAVYFTGWQKRLCLQKSASLHRVWSRPMIRNRRLFWGLIQMIEYWHLKNEIEMGNRLGPLTPVASTLIRGELVLPLYYVLLCFYYIA